MFIPAAHGESADQETSEQIRFTGHLKKFSASNRFKSFSGFSESPSRPVILSNEIFLYKDSNPNNVGLNVGDTIYLEAIAIGAISPQGDFSLNIPKDKFELADDVQFAKEQTISKGKLKTKASDLEVEYRLIAVQGSELLEERFVASDSSLASFIDSVEPLFSDTHNSLGLDSYEEITMEAGKPQGENKLGLDYNYTLNSVPTNFKPNKPKNNQCAKTYMQDLGLRTTRVGEVFSYNTSAKTQFTYKSSGTTKVNLGVGIAPASGVGFSQGSQVAKSFSSTSIFPTKVGTHKTGYNKMTRYHKNFWWCIYSFVSKQSIEATPVDMGGMSTIALSGAPNPPSGNCFPYHPGTVIFDSGRNVHWSNGVNIQNMIGINLSSQIGYTKETKVSVTIPAGKKFTICGTKGGPESINPGSIVVKR